VSITDTQRTNIKEKHREKTKTRMWADAQRNGRHAEYRGAIGESLVIPSLYHTAKFGWRSLLECRAVTRPIYENARLGRKVNFAPGKVLTGGQEPPKMYI